MRITFLAGSLSLYFLFNSWTLPHFAEPLFLAGASVHAGGIVQGDYSATEKQSSQNKLGRVWRPAQGKRLVHGVGKDGHELEEIHAVLIDACGQYSQIQHGQGKRRPHRGGVPESLLVYIGIPPKLVSR